MERPSVYLLRKSEALQEALQFFAREVSSRVTFLAQIDFWEWELDNLLYSFEGFAERSADWENAPAVRQKLAKLGISARHKVLKDLKAGRQWIQWYRKTSTAVPGSVRAPIEALVQVVRSWNELLDLCEHKVLDPHVGEAIELGARFVADLSKFRKRLPAGLSDAAEEPNDSGGT